MFIMMSSCADEIGENWWKETCIIVGRFVIKTNKLAHSKISLLTCRVRPQHGFRFINSGDKCNRRYPLHSKKENRMFAYYMPECYFVVVF